MGKKQKRNRISWWLFKIGRCVVDKAHANLEIKMLFAHWLRYDGISFRSRLVVVFVRCVYFVFVLSSGRIRIPNGERSLNLKDYNYTRGFRMEQRSPIFHGFYLLCRALVLFVAPLSAVWSGASICLKRNTTTSVIRESARDMRVEV